MAFTRLRKVIDKQEAREKKERKRMNAADKLAERMAAIIGDYKEAAKKERQAKKVKA